VCQVSPPWKAAFKMGSDLFFEENRSDPQLS
jgi:hypothetical protein